MKKIEYEIQIFNWTTILTKKKANNDNYWIIIFKSKNRKIEFLTFKSIMIKSKI